MQRTRDFLAVDLGASSGRVLAGRWDGSRCALQEVHRFANEPVSQMGRLQWDVLALWSQVKGGLARYAAWEPAREPTGISTPPRGELAGLGLDTWGVDFALLDRVGNRLGNPYHYRDRRTVGAMARAFELVPRHEVFVATGAQPMAFRGHLCRRWAQERPRLDQRRKTLRRNA
jgi:rhamnulokinase